VQLHQVRLLACRQLGLLAAQAALGLATGRPSRGAQLDQVGLEHGDHRQDVEQQTPDGVGGVVDGAGEVERDAAVSELGEDVPCVGQGAGEATTNSSPARAAAIASRGPGRARLVTIKS
jgi:hypothetical protein